MACEGPDRSTAAHPRKQCDGSELEVGDVERVLVFGDVSDQPPARGKPQIADAVLGGDLPQLMGMCAHGILGCRRQRRLHGRSAHGCQRSPVPGRAVARIASQRYS